MKKKMEVRKNIVIVPKGGPNKKIGALKKEEAITLEWNGVGRVKRPSQASDQENEHFWGMVNNICGLKGLLIFLAL